MKLSKKSLIFVEEYLKDLNATQAAIRSGYSKKTARSQGNRLLTNVNIQYAISRAKEDRTERTLIDADYVLQRHYEIDQLDALDVLDDDLNLRPLCDWPKTWRLALAGVDIMRVREWESDKSDNKKVESVIQKIKWPDKLKNLELLGKHVQVNAYRDKPVDENEEAPPLNITFTVNKAVDDVKVTNAST